MKLTILCVGKMKESYWTAACAEYGKRLKRFATVEVCEVEEEKVTQATTGDLANVRAKEGQRLLAKLTEGTYPIALCIDGKAPDSVQFSETLDRLFVSGKSHLTFVIGGSYGLSDDVVKACAMKLSFSNMTFPHQLMRVILMEQLFRAFKVMRGEQYHK